MKMRRTAFVMHKIVPDPKGPMVSGKPPGAEALERDMGKCPGHLQREFGHPGQRYAVLCGAVRQLTLVHRATTESKMVSCPKCIAILNRSNEASHAKPV